MRLGINTLTGAQGQSEEESDREQGVEDEGGDTHSMSALASSAYLARRAAQKERVRLLYRRALKDTLNWAVHRHLFYEDASNLRERFDANKHVEDLSTIDRLIEQGEALYDKFCHPDPYIVPWAPGGSKFTRNPPPPEGIEIVMDFGRENHLQLP